MQIERIRHGPIEIAARVAGDPSMPALVLLHGWPHDGTLYAPVLEPLGEGFFTIAFDLPAIGLSRGMPESAEKHALAKLLLDAAATLGAEAPVVAGIDVGGMIAFAAARDHGERISGVAIGNTVIPGIDPWEAVASDPRIFHFAFHAVPNLPERLVEGRERTYFNFFFDFLGSKEKPLPETVRTDFTAAYFRSEALTAGFDWYRAFPADAKHNAEPRAIDTPILYFRGDADGRNPDDYVAGLQATGARRVEACQLAGTAEFVPIEAPKRFAAMLADFAGRCVARSPALAD